jgi:hypothetical protein
MDNVTEQLAHLQAQLDWVTSLVTKKKPPTPWANFRRRVTKLVKGTATFPSFGQLSMFTSYLRSEKPYDQWQDSEILNRYYEYITYEETDEQRQARKATRRETVHAERAAELRKPLSEVNTTILLEDSESGEE